MTHIGSATHYIIAFVVPQGARCWRRTTGLQGVQREFQDAAPYLDAPDTLQGGKLWHQIWRCSAGQLIKLDQTISNSCLHVHPTISALAVTLDFMMLHNNTVACKRLREMCSKSIKARGSWYPSVVRLVTKKVERERITFLRVIPTMTC